jgi:hypothetical protein
MEQRILLVVLRSGVLVREKPLACLRQPVGCVCLRGVRPDTDASKHCRTEDAGFLVVERGNWNSVDIGLDLRPKR